MHQKGSKSELAIIKIDINVDWKLENKQQKLDTGKVESRDKLKLDPVVALRRHFEDSGIHFGPQLGAKGIHNRVKAERKHVFAGA